MLYLCNMKIKELIEGLSSYSKDDMEVRVLINCKNITVGVEQILPYNKYVMLCLNTKDEKNLINIRP